MALNPGLTIAIPTYNRPDCISSIVKELLAQLKEGCRILVVDNASDLPVAETLRGVLEAWPGAAVRVVRNPVNIGGDANILRCAELCETEWLWMMSDDDIIRGDAVEKVLSETAAHGDCICVNLAQEAHPRERGSLARGRSEFLKAFRLHFDSLLFLSTSVYRTEAIRPFLTFGYRQIPSFSPHVALLIMATGSHGQVFFSPKTIVEYVPARPGTGWSSFWVERGFPLLMDLPLSGQDRELLRQALRRRYGMKSLAAAWLNVLCYGMKAQDYGSCARLFGMILHRRAVVNPSLVEWFVGRLLLMSLLAPRISLASAGLVYRLLRNRSLDARAAMVGLTSESRV